MLPHDDGLLPHACRRSNGYSEYGISNPIYPPSHPLLCESFPCPILIQHRAITVQTRNVIKIGRPGYKVTKARDLTTNQRSLLFEVDYPEAEDGAQPRHRFMSAYEQKVEAPDKNYQVCFVLIKFSRHSFHWCNSVRKGTH